MRPLFLLLTFAALSHAQDEPIGATKKKLEAAADKIKSGDAKSKMEGLREAADLKGDAISLLPVIFKEIIATRKKADEKITLQAIIASETIDAELHGHVMALKSANSWADRADVLERVNNMPDAKIRRIDHVVRWMIPQFKSLKPTPNLRARRFLEKGKIKDDLPGGDEKAIHMLIEIMRKLDGRLTAEREELALASLRVGNGWVRQRAYEVFWHQAKYTECTKDKKSELLSMFSRGIGDPDGYIQLMCIVHIGLLGDDAKEAIDRIRKIAATHESKIYRDVAAEALRQIEAPTKVRKEFNLDDADGLKAKETKEEPAKKPKR